MPVINVMLYLGVSGAHPALAIMLVATVGLAALSWFLVEKPALGLKKKTLHAH